MKKFLTAVLLIVPTLAFALDYTDVSGRYTDAPFSVSEAAGISLLTNIGAVSGNPDGSYRAERLLNRAEFLKIILLSSSAEGGASASCFPDVHAEDWFSQYVCRAKQTGIVKGNPD